MKLGFIKYIQKTLLVQDIFTQTTLVFVAKILYKLSVQNEEVVSCNNEFVEDVLNEILSYIQTAKHEVRFNSVFLIKSFFECWDNIRIDVSLMEKIKMVFCNGCLRNAQFFLNLGTSLGYQIKEKLC